MISDDDDLLELIADAVAVDQPPSHLVDAAYRSRSWANVDAELAELIEDSADLAVAAVRSTDTRRLVFEGIGVLDLEINAAAQTLQGTLDPPGSISLNRPDGSVEALEAGAVVQSFVATGITSGPLRITIQSSAGDWRTGWFTI